MTIRFKCGYVNVDKKERDMIWTEPRKDDIYVSGLIHELWCFYVISQILSSITEFVNQEPFPLQKYLEQSSSADFL